MPLLPTLEALENFLASWFCPGSQYMCIQLQHYDQDYGNRFHCWWSQLAAREGDYNIKKDADFLDKTAGFVGKLTIIPMKSKNCW